MTRPADIEKPNDQAFAAHDEYASDHALAVLIAPVRHDNGQLRDITKLSYVFGVALLASFGGFSFGYGVISIILAMTQFRQYYPQIHPDSPDYGFHVGFMTAMPELGAFVGCLFFPSVADRISRKWGLTVATVFFVVGAIIQTAALNYDALVAGRFIGGIGVGTLAMEAPLFGPESDMSLILSGMVNVCQLIGGIPIAVFLDRVGRRRLAVLGGVIMAILHLVMAELMGKFGGDWPSHQAVDLYVLSYSMSYGPLAWVLTAEVFPSSKRAKRVGAATAMIWLSKFIIGVVVPEMLIKLGWGNYLFFGMVCLGAAVFSYIFVPETSN
ncbi:uncharacterized protein KD926_002257 [Aspergillus affinis]|uniref:uncharacterized protein n=1 Tax=Aspergillus affinis TaxID=1070780 RepID=UPI0022FF2727|nr:uncharacterized protein KD926_002257 [Aspergillus affinis]KAI9036116.1 hypothetical protein KD926_002257 [Aspergillus affinis]